MTNALPPSVDAPVDPIDHRFYTYIGLAQRADINDPGVAMYLCTRGDGMVVADRHAHDDFHRMYPMWTPEVEDLMMREPASDFEG